MSKRIKFISGDGTKIKPSKAVRKLIYEVVDKAEKATSIRPNVAVLPPHAVKSEKARG